MKDWSLIEIDRWILVKKDPCKLPSVQQIRVLHKEVFLLCIVLYEYEYRYGVCGIMVIISACEAVGCWFKSSQAPLKIYRNVRQFGETARSGFQRLQVQVLSFRLVSSLKECCWPSFKKKYYNHVATGYRELCRYAADLLIYI